MRQGEEARPPLAPSSLLEVLRGSGRVVGFRVGTCRTPVLIPHHAQVLP